MTEDTAVGEMMAGFPANGPVGTARVRGPRYASNADTEYTEALPAAVLVETMTTAVVVLPLDRATLGITVTWGEVRPAEKCHRV